VSDDPRSWYLKNHLRALKQLQAETAERAMIAGGYRPPYTLEAFTERRGRAAAQRSSNLYNHYVTQVNSLGVAIEALEWLMRDES
jgi:hypothetical protein